jgi:hypothetical protein
MSPLMFDVMQITALYPDASAPWVGVNQSNTGVLNDMRQSPAGTV